MECYSDVDYANDENTRRSLSDIIFKISGGAVAWANKRQQSVSLSMTEAEYVTAREAAKDALWLSRMLAKLRQTVPG